MDEKQENGISIPQININEVFKSNDLFIGKIVYSYFMIKSRLIDNNNDLSSEELHELRSFIEDLEHCWKKLDICIMDLKMYLNTQSYKEM